MKFYSLLILTLAFCFNCFGYSDIPDDFCGASINTTEGKIKILPIKIIATTSTDYDSGIQECQDYIIGRLNRVCLSLVFKESAKIAIVVHRKFSGNYSQSFITAECNTSIFGNWSFKPDISYNGTYVDSGISTNDFPKTTLFSDKP